LVDGGFGDGGEVTGGIGAGTAGQMRERNKKATQDSEDDSVAIFDIPMHLNCTV
jgi:hypothetical protein